MPEPQSQAKPADPTKKPAELLKIVNNERRPVMFRITGRTIRIGPCGMTEIVGEHHASAPELRALCAKGTVQILKTSTADTEEPPKGPAAETPSNKQAPDKVASEGPQRQPAEARTRARS